MRYDILNRFREIWAIDFEFGLTPDGLPIVRCLVAKELRSGRTIRLWVDQLSRLTAPPFEIGPDVLYVAFYAAAEMSCFIALGWPLPYYVLDLYVEFRNMTNGRKPIGGYSLLGAMLYYRLDAISVAEKREMQNLSLRDGLHTEVEILVLLDYCESDVIALVKLFWAMLPKIDLLRALYRGRYTKAVARMEANGIPIDVANHELLKNNWKTIKRLLIQEVDKDYGVFEDERFVTKNFMAYLDRSQLCWKLLKTGKPALDIETFRSMSRTYPAVYALYQLRKLLGTVRSFDLPVGPEGRSRCMLSPFSSKTGRNQPSTTKFLFSLPKWLRCLILSREGYSLLYIDWKQQEFGIAAGLSGDLAMIDAYLSGDPYLGFAKLAKVVPPDATEMSHPAVRKLYKSCVLALQYGMNEYGLAPRLGVSIIEARELLQQHRRAFPKYWEWSEAAVNCSLLGIPIRTVFGWTLHPVPDPNPRSLANFPIQANGAEMMRLAAILATEKGIRVCAPVHDAFLIEAPTSEIEAVAADMQQAMKEASRIVLGGLELDSDVIRFDSPNRYMDKDGVEMWNKVMLRLDEMELPEQPL